MAEREGSSVEHLEFLKELAEALDLGGDLQREMDRSSRLGMFVGPGNLIEPRIHVDGRILGAPQSLFDSTFKDQLKA